MPSKYIGRNRSDAVYRIIFGGIILGTAFVIPGILIVIGVAAAVIYHVIDVVLQAVFNSGGLSNSGVWGQLRDLYQWPLDMLDWLFWGDRGFPWTPAMSL